MKTFADIRVGDRRELSHTVTEADITAFAQLTGDRNPLHLDREFAQRTPFGGLIAQGLLTTGYIVGVIGTWLPGAGSFCLGIKADYHAPVHVGEVLHVVVTTTKKIDSLRVVVLTGEAYRRDGTLAASAEVRVQMMPRDRGCS